MDSQLIYKFFSLMVSSTTLVTVVIVVVVAWTIRQRLRAKDLPPGPKGWPLLGVLPAFRYTNVTRGEGTDGGSQGATDLHPPILQIPRFVGTSGILSVRNTRSHGFVVPSKYFGFTNNSLNEKQCLGLT